MKNKKQKIKDQYRQGDVLIEEIDSIMVRAHQAVAWTFGKTEETYAPCLET